MRNNYNSWKPGVINKKRIICKKIKSHLETFIRDYIDFNEEKKLFPQTKVKNPEPKKKDENWVIWAAWADQNYF